MTDEIFIGGGGKDYAQPQGLRLKYANRHGLIAGATGTGKTVTLQILAEGFSKAGVPVFLSDVKGDLSGLAKAGSPDHKLHQAFMDRAARIGFSDYAYERCPVTFWDLFGEQGHPVRTTVSEMGPLLLSRLMELSEAQEGILEQGSAQAQASDLLGHDEPSDQADGNGLCTETGRDTTRGEGIEAQRHSVLARGHEDLGRRGAMGPERMTAEPLVERRVAAAKAIASDLRAEWFRSLNHHRVARQCWVRG